MSKLNKLFAQGLSGGLADNRKLMAEACAVLACLGVALTASGNALAQQQFPRGAQPVERVRIESMRYLEREGNPGSNNLTGRVVGGAFGAAVGNKMGKGNGRKLSTLALASFGQSVGAEVERRMNFVPVVEFTVSTQNGRRFIVYQDAGPQVSDCQIGMDAYMAGGQVARCLTSVFNHGQPLTQAQSFPEGKPEQVKMSGLTFEFKNSMEALVFHRAAAEINKIAKESIESGSFDSGAISNIKEAQLNSLRSAAEYAGGKEITDFQPTASGFAP